MTCYPPHLAAGLLAIYYKALPADSSREEQLTSDRLTDSFDRLTEPHQLRLTASKLPDRRSSLPPASPISGRFMKGADLQIETIGSASLLDEFRRRAGSAVVAQHRSSSDVVASRAQHRHSECQRVCAISSRCRTGCCAVLSACAVLGFVPY